MSQPWWNTAWTRRVQLTRTTANVLADFPNCIFLNAAKTNGYAGAKPDLTDLRIADANGNLLSRQLDTVNLSGTSIVHCKKSLVSGANALWAYWGNLAAQDMSAAEKQATWDSDFAAVWPLNDANDSTAGGHHLTVEGSLTFGDAAGIVGAATTFNGTNARLSAADATCDFNHDWTVSGWFKYNGSAGGYGGMFSKQLGGTINDTMIRIHRHWDHSVCARYAWTWSNYFYKYSVAHLDVGDWHHVVVRYRHTDNPASGTFWFEGVKDANTSNGTSLTSITGAPIYIGYMLVNATDYYWNGLMDDIRLSKVARSDDWIEESCAQQSADVWAAGAVENAPAGGAAVPIVMMMRET